MNEYGRDGEVSKKWINLEEEKTCGKILADPSILSSSITLNSANNSCHKSHQYPIKDALNQIAKQSWNEIIPERDISKLFHSMHIEDSTTEAWPDFAFNYTHPVQFASINDTYADKNEDAITVLFITMAIIYFLLIQAAYLINQNLYTWSAVMQAKHLKMLRDREYVLLRAYSREMQFSRLMQEEVEDEEHPEEATIE